jgi:hypothetical protein
MTTIQFRVTATARRTSSEVNTIRYIWKDGMGEAESKQIKGVEWEEIEFTTIEEEQPVIQVANVKGNAYLPNSPIKLVINNPELFGIYKVGDIIDFMPLRTKGSVEVTVEPTSNTTN